MFQPEGIQLLLLLIGQIQRNARTRSPAIELSPGLTITPAIELSPDLTISPSRTVPLSAGPEATTLTITLCTSYPGLGIHSGGHQRGKHEHTRCSYQCLFHNT